jgi:hypothetical protein
MSQSPRNAFAPAQLHSRQHSGCPPTCRHDSIAGSPRSECLFDRLPDELLVLTLSAVGSEDVVMRVHAVCRRWRAVCRNVPIFVENWGDVFAYYCPKVQKVCCIQCVSPSQASNTVADLTKSFAERFRVEGLPSGWMSLSHLAWVAQFCPHLRTLRIIIRTDFESPCNTATAIKRIAETCGSVRTIVVDDEIDEEEAEDDDLDVDGLALTDETLVLLGRSFRHLSSLKLGDCSDITDDGLVGLVQVAPSLRSLVLSCCDAVTDAGLKRVLDAAPSLISLKAQGCASITAASVKLCGERLMLDRDC